MSREPKMISMLHQIDTNHEELIHDSQANFHGTRLATCSNDGKIKIFELNGGQSRLLTELNGHEGPVWQLDWSHPEYGNLLASCSYDRRVIIWQEIQGTWEKVKEYRDHDSSVNSVQWAPREFGLILGCASADGSISILRYRSEDSDWDSRRITNAHSVGVNAISWAPPISSVSTIYRPQANVANQTTAATTTATTNTAGQLGISTGGLASQNASLLGSGNVSNTTATATAANTSTTATAAAATILSKPALVERFVSGGCDSLVKIWKYIQESDKWVEERSLDMHSDWVRDVAWAPSIGLPKWYIASCSQDKKVIIWTNAEGPNGHEWESKTLNDFDDIVWHVSWSVMGNILAVSCGENRISLWKEDMNGEFRCISDTTT